MRPPKARQGLLRLAGAVFRSAWGQGIRIFSVFRGSPRGYREASDTAFVPSTKPSAASMAMTIRVDVMKPRILFVDDERNILDSLRLCLRPMRAKWDMSFALGGREALEMLALVPHDVVVSDMRMPGMDGDQLLQAVMERFPECVRIVLSGYSEVQSALRIAELAHQHLSKPCPPADIIQAVEKALSQRDMLQDVNLRGMVGRLKNLPSLPEVYKKLMEALQDENVTSKELAAIVGRDVGMTATILRLVNSSFFGVSTRISSIHHAVNLLGGQTIRVLVLSTHLFNSIDNAVFPLDSIRMLWEHSWRVACFAKAIAKSEGASQAEVDESFIAGMLHDVGKVVLATNLSGEYQEVLSGVRDDCRPVHELELEVLGTTHAAVGVYLMGIWGFTSQSLEAVAWHHALDKQCCSTFTPALAVHVANALDHDLVRIQEDHARRPLLSLEEDPGPLAARVDGWRSLCAGFLTQGCDGHAAGIVPDADE